MLDMDVRPDAEVQINGTVYYLEWDRGTMSYAQIVRHRFRMYERCPHLALWVCSTNARRDGLRSQAERIRSVALFTTAAEALASPHNPIWIDYGGERVALPRQQPA